MKEIIFTCNKLNKGMVVRKKEREREGRREGERLANARWLCPTRLAVMQPSRKKCI
jgi:hypothetical protein